MDNLEQFLGSIAFTKNREKLAKVIGWVQETFPELDLEFKWNQPMFIHHGTYIIAFSVAKAHFSFSPEEAGIKVFREEAKAIGYQTTKMLIKVKWIDQVDFDFIEKVIKFNIEDKKDCDTFWRSNQ